MQIRRRNRDTGYTTGSVSTSDKNHPQSKDHPSHSDTSVAPKRPTSLMYGNLKSRSRSFFRKERATSADPASRSSKSYRNSSYEPLYSNFCNNLTSQHRNGHQNDHPTLVYGCSTPEPYMTSRSGSMDSEFLMKNIEHTYRPKTMPMSRMKESKSMINFPKSDSRMSIAHEITQDGVISTKNRIKKFILQTTGSSSFSKTSSSSNRTKTSLNNARNHINVNNNGRMSGGLTSSSSFWHLTSSKPISVSLLDYVSNQIKAEGIDLTDEPYSDAVRSFTSCDNTTSSHYLVISSVICMVPSLFFPKIQKTLFYSDPSVIDCITFILSQSFSPQLAIRVYFR